MWLQYQNVRAVSMRLCESLEIDDLNLQAVPETSPLKWHLAHTTWFFETFLLKPYLARYEPFNPHFEYLFNSYYNAVGKQFPRARRHLLSRPTINEVYAYRQHVDAGLHRLLLEEATTQDIKQRLILGLNHEQQHQELMLTDLKFNWALNPLHPVYSASPLPVSAPPAPLAFVESEAGLFETGCDTAATCKTSPFAFDNEGPRHQV